MLPTPLPLLDLSDHGLYPGFFGQTLDFASFRRKSRRPLAINTGINTEARAWEWARDQVCSGSQDPAWLRRALVGQLGVIFAQWFHKIGGRRIPINTGPATASQRFANRSVLTHLRISSHKWAVEYFDAVSRNVTRVRVRLSLEQSGVHVGADDLQFDSKGNIIAEPPDDKLRP